MTRKNNAPPDVTPPEMHLTLCWEPMPKPDSFPYYVLYFVNAGTGMPWSIKVRSGMWASSDDELTNIQAGWRDLGAVHPGGALIVESDSAGAHDYVTCFEFEAQAGKRVYVGEAEYGKGGPSGPEQLDPRLKRLGVEVPITWKPKE